MAAFERASGAARECVTLERTFIVPTSLWGTMFKLFAASAATLCSAIVSQPSWACQIQYHIAVAARASDSVVSISYENGGDLHQYRFPHPLRSGTSGALTLSGEGETYVEAELTTGQQISGIIPDLCHYTQLFVFHDHINAN
jgi:hypothetical protein